MPINCCHACLINPYCVSYKEMEKPTASNNERANQMPSDGTTIQSRTNRSSPGMLASSCTSPSLPQEGDTYLEPLAHEKLQTLPAILKAKVLVCPLCLALSYMLFECEYQLIIIMLA